MFKVCIQVKIFLGSFNIIISELWSLLYAVLQFDVTHADKHQNPIITATSPYNLLSLMKKFHF